MNIQKYLLLSLLMVTATVVRPEAATTTTTYTLNIEPTPAATEVEKTPVKTDKKKGAKELAKKYCISILTGSIVGYTTGSLEKLMEKQFDGSVPTKIFFMIVEAITRSNILKAMLKDFDEYDIKNSEPLTQFSSTIASWFAYF